MFSILNGQIIDPDGNIFIAKGINVNAEQASSGVLALFPGINMVRVPFHSYSSPSSISAFVQQATALKIVVEIEDHTSISGGPYTGTQLNNELAWYTSMATAFNGNPYVWFGCLNEPGQGTNLPAIWAQNQAIYNAIRNTGNQTIIMLSVPSGGYPGTIGTNGKGFDGSGPMVSSPINMTNVVWDFHFYGWVAGRTGLGGTGYSTNPTTIKAALLGAVSGGYGIAACQSILSKDGVVPVIVGETGVSTTGSLPDDPNGIGIVDVVCQTAGINHSGFLPWAWAAGGNSDNLTSGGKLTTYGKQVATYIAGNNPTPPVPVPTPPTPNSTTFITPGIGSFTDSLNNVYTVSTGGAATQNGKPIAGGSGTAAMVYYNNTVYGQDSGSHNWFTWNGTAWNSTVAPPTPTPPTPPTPPVTPTPPTPPPTNLPPLVKAPIANAQKGTWMAMDISGPGLRNMHFNFLLPAGWTPNNSYGVLVHEHEQGEGIEGVFYSGGYTPLKTPQAAGNNDYLPNNSQADLWYNNTDFRTNYPFIIVLPYCNQTSDTSGVTSNFGGWTSQDDNEDNVVACVQWIIKNYFGHPGFVAITGDSLGGIGSWAGILDYNIYNGTKGKVYCAALPFAGVIERAGMLSSDVITRMKQVPVFAISGAGDTTSRIQDYNQPYWDAMAPTLKGKYPGPNGAQAPGTMFWYLQDPNLGHDVWDTYRPKTFWKDWLMTFAPVPIPTPPVTPPTPTPPVPTPPTPPVTPPVTPPPTPTPPTPTSVVGLEVTIPVQFAWQPTDNAVSYTPSYRITGTTDWTVLPSVTNTVAVLILDFGKDYDFNVMANFG